MPKRSFTDKEMLEAFLKTDKSPSSFVTELVGYYHATTVIRLKQMLRDRGLEVVNYNLKHSDRHLLQTFIDLGFKSPSAVVKSVYGTRNYRADVRMQGLLKTFAEVLNNHPDKEHMLDQVFEITKQKGDQNENN